MKPADWFAFVLLSALWGASFLFIRVAAPAFGPVFLMDVRVWLAGLSMLLFATITGKRISFRGRVKSFLFLGALNAGVPFTLIAEAGNGDSRFTDCDDHWDNADVDSGGCILSGGRKR